MDEPKYCTLVVSVQFDGTLEVERTLEQGADRQIDASDYALNGCISLQIVRNLEVGGRFFQSTLLYAYCQTYQYKGRRNWYTALRAPGPHRSRCLRFCALLVSVRPTTG